MTLNPLKTGTLTETLVDIDSMKLVQCSTFTVCCIPLSLSPHPTELDTSDSTVKMEFLWAELTASATTQQHKAQDQLSCWLHGHTQVYVSSASWHNDQMNWDTPKQHDSRRHTGPTHTTHSKHICIYWISTNNVITETTALAHLVQQVNIIFRVWKWKFSTISTQVIEDIKVKKSHPVSSVSQLVLSVDKLETMFKTYKRVLQYTVVYIICII